MDGDGKMCKDLCFKDECVGKGLCWCECKHKWDYYSMYMSGQMHGYYEKLNNPQSYYDKHIPIQDDPRFADYDPKKLIPKPKTLETKYFWTYRGQIKKD